MPPYHPIVALLHGFPEALAFVFLVYALLGIRGQPIRLLLLGTLSLSLMVISRNIGAPFPAHIIVILIVLSLLISRWESVTFRRVTLAWGTAIVILTVFETFFIQLAMVLLRLSPEQLLAQPLLWVAVAWPQIIGLALVALWARRRGGIKPFKGVSGS